MKKIDFDLPEVIEIQDITDDIMKHAKKGKKLTIKILAEYYKLNYSFIRKRLEFLVRQGKLERYRAMIKEGTDYKSTVIYKLKT